MSRAEQVPPLALAAVAAARLAPSGLIPAPVHLSAHEVTLHMKTKNLAERRTPSVVVAEIVEEPPATCEEPR